MAERIETFDVLIPLGTAIAAAQITNLSFNLGLVTQLEIQIPPGPSGLVGFRIRHSGQVIIPNNSANWIIADNDIIKWNLEGFPVGAAWSIQAYNTDFYDHTLYLRFLVNETRRNLVERATLVSITPQGGAEDFE